MSVVQCSVSGLDSKDGKTQIKNELNKMEGVQKVAVNLMTGTVEINYNEPASENMIKNRIEKIGYKIVY